jgi:phenylacetate-CoA ligase
MRLGERARGLVYWGRDYLQGSPIRQHAQELDQAMIEPGIAIERTRRLGRELIEHACNTTGYYRQFKGAQELSEFPILQKATIRKRYPEFLSSAYEQRSLIRVMTSGSYGTPFTFYLTPDKKARQTAEVIYFGGWAGYRVGHRHAYVRVTSNKGRLTQFLQNEILMNPSLLSETWLEAQRQVLRNQRIVLLISYPSSAVALAEHCRTRGDGPKSFHLQGIIAYAEPIHESGRATLHEVFGCPVLSRYSSAEFGVLAQQCRQEGHHHLSLAHYIIEFVSPERDEPASPGQLARVIVTDPYSHAMPLIRYDIGDLAVAGKECPCGLPGPTIERIEGRAVEEVQSTIGERVSPFAINAAMQDLEGIVQYQFAQTDGRRYEMRLSILPSFHQHGLVRERLRSIVGADAEVSLSLVDQILPLPSGKRPYIINEWRRQAG